MIDFLTVKEAGEKWNVSGRMVTIYCKDGRIEGAIKKGNLWLVPIDAEKPVDGRTTAAKNIKKISNQYGVVSKKVGDDLSWAKKPKNK